MQYREENNYPKALMYSVGAMVLFLLISYLITFGSFTPPVEMTGTGGILVNYGTAETGMGDDIMSTEEPSTAPNANNTPPDRVITEPQPDNAPSSEASNKSVVTQNIEDAPAVSTSPKSTSNTPSTSTPKESKPTVNENALYKGKKSTGTGGGDGTGSTPGNQGDPDGSNLATNYGSGGTGFGDVRLPNRTVIDRPKVEDSGQETGIIVINIRVDKSGSVVDAKIGRGTTIGSNSLVQKCIRAAQQIKFNKSENADYVQEGSVTFKFKVR